MQLQTFNTIKDELASELFTIEFDVILKNNIELSNYSEEQLPVSLALAVIRNVCLERRALLQESHPQKSSRSEQDRMAKAYEETWAIQCSKVAFDSYRRPVCFVVPPQLLAATLVYMSDLILVRLATFSRKQFETCLAEIKSLSRPDQAAQDRDRDAQVLGFKSPNAQSNGNSGKPGSGGGGNVPVDKVTGLQVLQETLQP